MNDRPYLSMQPKFSTPVQVMIGLVQGMQPNFGQLGEQLPLLKSVTKNFHRYLGNNQPCPRSAIEFWSSQ
jgi:hypothetical protein